MSEIQPRIVGSEMEWGVIGRIVDTKKFNSEVESISEATCKYLHPDIRTVSQMLSNGSRFYQDVGAHLEYATPEDISFESATVNEFAGEQIVIDALHRLIRSKEKYDGIKLRKRVIGSDGVTWGYHINFLADRSAIQNPQEDLRLMGLHYATSMPLLGAGAIVRDKVTRELRYSFGQKVNGLFNDYLTGTTGTQKAVINLRDEPLSSVELYRRVHHTSTDPHILAWATRMTLGSYSLVLRAIEQGYGDQLPLTPSDNSAHPLLDLAQQNSADLSMRGVVHEIGGKTLRQFDVQHEILNIVSKTDHTDEEADILAEWRKAIEDLETDPKQLTFRSDAITRLTLIRKKVEVSGGDPDDMGDKWAQKTDDDYDTLATIWRDDESPRDSYDRSVPERLRARVHDNHLDMAIVMNRMFQPPQTTRAKIRGEAIAQGASTAGWHFYKPSPDKGAHALDDPYMTEESGEEPSDSAQAPASESDMMDWWMDC